MRRNRPGSRSLNTFQVIERRRYQAEVSQKQRQERQEKLSEAMSLLQRGIEGIFDSEGFANYLRTMARFHTYSANNVALIRAQRPEATQAAGYKAWQALGRQVRKGEKGMIVFVPHRERVRESPDRDQQEKEPAGVSSFVYNFSRRRPAANRASGASRLRRCRRAKRMPPRAARSGTRGRPPFGLGSSFGRSGAMASQRSSGTSGLLMTGYRHATPTGFATRSYPSRR